MFFNIILNVLCMVQSQIQKFPCVESYQCTALSELETWKKNNHVCLLVRSVQTRSDSKESPSAQWMYARSMGSTFRKFCASILRHWYPGYQRFFFPCTGQNTSVAARLDRHRKTLGTQGTTLTKRYWNIFLVEVLPTLIYNNSYRTC